MPTKRMMMMPTKRMRMVRLLPRRRRRMVMLTMMPRRRRTIRKSVSSVTGQRPSPLEDCAAEKI